MFVFFVLASWRTGLQPLSLYHTHLCVAHALRLRHLVGEVSLLKPGGAHALICGRVGARRRVWRVEACLDQGFARFTGDHGLEFASSKSVHVTRFAGHK